MTESSKFNWRYWVYMVLALLIASENSSAAGFAVFEQSVSGLGNAYAGNSSAAEDISTIFYNPAGLSRLSGTQAVFGMHSIIPSIQFNTDQSSDILGQPLTGGEGGEAGKDIFIPNFYVATDLTENLRAGLGISSPFGLMVNYSQGWKGRYQAINSELRTVNINPTLAFAVNEQFSIGVGFSAQYLDTKLTNAIDFGAICIAQLGAAKCSAQGLASQAADGLLEIKADDWSWGYNIGFLYEPFTGTRFGLAYRSHLGYTVRGKARFQVPRPALPLTAGGAFKDTRVRADVDFPESVAFGIFHQATAEWAVMGDITWTRWNRIKKLTLEFDNAAQPNSTQTFDWENTLRLSIGVTYKPTPAWTLRSGFAYDQSPVADAERREFRIPDNDRYWITAGLSYRATENFKFNLAYAHLFLQDSKLSSVDSFGHALTGTFRGHIDIISAELQWTY